MLAFIAIGFTALAASGAGPTRDGSKYAYDAVLVSFKPGAPEFAATDAMGRHDLIEDKHVRSPFFRRLKLGPAARRAGVKAVMAQLRNESNVALVEPDYVVAPAAVPNDTLYGEVWSLNNTGQTGGTIDADIDAPEAWDKSTGTTSVVVAILDSGVDYMHPDLAPNIMRDSLGNIVGYDFADDDDDPLDQEGHGTHIAGIIGAKGNNALGVTGICWSVKIMPVRMLTYGGGYLSHAIQSFDFARTKGAKVINASWDWPNGSKLLLDSIKRARDAGILVVASAGNESRNQDGTPTFPANYNFEAENVISVASTNSSDALADTSNYGPNTVDIAAPGDEILSTFNGEYELQSGTSMAAAHVTGVAALIKAKYPSLTVAQIKARLFGGVDRPSALTGKVRTGRVNADKSLAVDTVVPGAPLSLAVTQRTGSGLVLSVQSSGDDGAVGTASFYDLRYSAEPITSTTFFTSSAAAYLPAPAPSGTTQSYYLDGLEPGKTYYLALRAFDEAGNMSGLKTPGSFGYTTLSLISALSDSADSTLKFSGQKVSGTVDSTWAASTEQRFSGAKSYSDSPGAYYQYSSDTALTQITPVTLNGAGWKLVFRAKMQTLENADFLRPEVSPDGGTTWYGLGWELSGFLGWNSYTVPLGTFNNNPNVKVRFRFTTDTWGRQHGVWIDDIQICRDPTAADLFVDTVEGAPQFTGQAPWATTTSTSVSPTHSYTDSPAGNYANNVYKTLTQNTATPIVYPGAVLQFALKTNLEAGADSIRIEYSTDGGATWSWPMMWARWGNEPWRYYSFPLTGYVGQSLKVRFGLYSDSSVTLDGAYVDDIRITGITPSAIGGTPPNPPNTLTATPASATQVDLTWKDQSTSETQWRVERKTGTGAFTQIASINSTTGAATSGVISYSNTGTLANTTYTYRVRAYNASGMSNYTPTLTITTPP